MTAGKEETVTFAPESTFRAAVIRRFGEIESELRAVITEAEVHHVGSTAIPGSLTKGDLDVQVRVSRDAFAGAKAELMNRYAVNEGGFSGPDAISFEDDSRQPSVGIHLTVTGSPSDVQLAFRDLLLASDALRQEYDDLKRRYEGGSMDEYRSAKAKFVARVLFGDA